MDIEEHVTNKCKNMGYIFIQMEEDLKVNLKMI